MSAIRSTLLPALAALALPALAPSTAHAQAPGLTLGAGHANATLHLEVDTSSGVAGDVDSLAPDLAVGVTDDLTLSVIHSTFGRTGFRGVAGAGVCGTDACANTYDNVGLEALYSLARGPLAIAAVGGVHAWSFDREHYVAKAGLKIRYKAGKLVLQTLPAVTIALTERDGMPPAKNRDRLWAPVTASYPIYAGLSGGLATGLKFAFDDVGASYEVATGAFATYVVSPELLLGASWIHGKMFGGDGALPNAMQGRDSRALHMWVSATY